MTKRGRGIALYVYIRYDFQVVDYTELNSMPSESLWSKICTDKHDYFILRVCYRRDENIYFSVLRLQQMGIIPYYIYIYIYIYIDGRL